MELISLRGHHIICLNFFTGEGYNKEFVESLHKIVKKMKREKIIIVKGADDVCRKCPFLIHNVCKDEKDISEMDKKALDLLSLNFGDIIYIEDIKNKIKSIFDKWCNLYCISCEYLNICSNTTSFKNLIKLQ